jgi:rod shape-determining protein MreD
MKLKIAFVVALAVLLQTTLRNLLGVGPLLVHVDLPLAAATYFALRRDVVGAMFAGFAAGLATDVFSSGLLGANAFSKTLIAYLIAALATRVALDNPVVRIPVIAGAAALDSVVVVLLHRVLGQPPLSPFAEATGYKLIGTTVAGTLVFYVLDIFLSDRARQRRHFAFRRRAARRSTLVRR